jgi:hypothetical protein
VALTTSPLWVVGGLMAFSAGKEYVGRRAFEAEAWRDSTQAYGANPVRIRMVDDLLYRHDFLDWPRERVIALLGEPSRTGYFSQYDLVYWMGPERGLVRMDSEWLVFRLDVHGRVSEYRVVRD